MTLETLFAVKNISHSAGVITAGTEFRASEPFAKQVLASGEAVRLGTRFVWDKLHLPDSHVVCIASGPSLTQEDCEAVRRWREAAFNVPVYRYVFVVNTTYKAAPWADVLYASDEGWWDKYNLRVQHEFKGRTFSTASVGDLTPKHIDKYKLNCVPLERGSGLNRKFGYINSGGNSGYQVIGLAYLAGATTITLLGYDMTPDGKQEHWHPEHEWFPRYDRPYREWCNAFPKLYEDLRVYGVTLQNASRRTALKIPRVALEQALNG